MTSDIRNQCLSAALSRNSNRALNWATDLEHRAQKVRREKCALAAITRYIQGTATQSSLPLKCTNAKPLPVSAKVSAAVEALFPAPHWTQTSGRCAKRVKVSDPIARACVPAWKDKRLACEMMRQWKAQDRKERAQRHKARMEQDELHFKELCERHAKSAK